MRRRAVDQRNELEVEVVCEPSRIAAECFVAAYDRVAPLARRDINVPSTTTTAIHHRPKPQSGGAHG